MPRKSDVDSHGQGNNSESSGFSTTLFDRRSCLRVGGAALASAVAIGGMGTAAAKEVINANEVSGTTYEVPSDDRYRILVGENQYGDYGDLTNAVIEAEGKRVQIVTFGSDWEIRNVGISGQVDGENPVIDLKTDGGDGLVENVYFGDGTGSQPAVFVSREHSGTITIRDLYVAGSSDNGIYASTPGLSDGGNGATQIENVYSENNNRAHFRIGGEGSYVRDSVAVSTDVPPTEASGAKTSRGIWARHTEGLEATNVDITIKDGLTSAVWATDGASLLYEDSDYVTDYEYGDFEGDVETENIEDNPSTSVPSGVPTSVEEAVGGGASGSSDGRGSDSDSDSDSESSGENSNSEGDDSASSSEEEAEEKVEDSSDSDESSDLSHTITIESQSDDEVRYEFTVADEVRDLGTGDVVDGDTASGQVHGYKDEYEFEGEIKEFRYSGPIAISVDGDEVYED